MNDSDFDVLLRSARDESPLPGSFRQGVWRRIENDANQPTALSWYHGLLASIVRPWGAVTGFAATVALGLWLGVATTPDATPSATAYLKSISPIAHSDR